MTIFTEISPSEVDGDIAIAPWLEELIEQYREQTTQPASRSRALVAAAVLGIAGAALLPVALRFVHAAYPSEPEKQKALEICSRADPTFLRFLAGERDACYERIIGLTARAAGGVDAANNFARDLR